MAKSSGSRGGGKNGSRPKGPGGKPSTTGKPSGKGRDNAISPKADSYITRVPVTEVLLRSGLLLNTIARPLAWGSSPCHRVNRQRV